MRQARLYQFLLYSASYDPSREDEGDCIITRCLSRYDLLLDVRSISPALVLCAGHEPNETRRHSLE